MLSSVQDENITTNLDSQHMTPSVAKTPFFPTPCIACCCCQCTFLPADVLLLELEPELNGQVKTVCLRYRQVPPFQRLGVQAEQSREAWRRAIITEQGRNANQPAMRWVWVGWDAHAYHTGLWKTTPPEAPAARFYCVYCSRHGLLLCNQL